VTKEEAIKLLSQIMDIILVSNSWLPSTDNPIKEAFGMAISALQAQESCNNLATDTISRQAAIDALNEYFTRIGRLKRRGLTKGEKAISLDTVGTIKTLPSVQPKTGVWILTPMPSDNYRYKCSICNRHHRERYDYCPNCGAKMRVKE